jgi:cobalt-zinc-cadmium efflux system protein
VKKPVDCHAVRRELEEMLATEHHLEHTTLQVDHVSDEVVTMSPTHRASGQIPER